MGESPDPDAQIDMKALARRLTIVGMPSQTVIARESGVSQSTVSRASQGLIKTPSDGAQRLWAYTSTRLDVIATAPSAQMVEAASTAKRTSAKPRRRQGRRRRVDRTLATDVSGLTPAELAKLAMAGLKDYLADAFDPVLVIEQLSVLRRAQDRGAR